MYFNIFYNNFNNNSLMQQHLIFFLSLLLDVKQRLGYSIVLCNDNCISQSAWIYNDVNLRGIVNSV